MFLMIFHFDSFDNNGLKLLSDPHPHPHTHNEIRGMRTTPVPSDADGIWIDAGESPADADGMWIDAREFDDRGQILPWSHFAPRQE